MDELHDSFSPDYNPKPGPDGFISLLPPDPPPAPPRDAEAEGRPATAGSTAPSETGQMQRSQDFEPSEGAELPPGASYERTRPPLDEGTEVPPARPFAER